MAWVIVAGGPGEPGREQLKEYRRFQCCDGVGGVFGEADCCSCGGFVALAFGIDVECTSYGVHDPGAGVAVGGQSGSGRQSGYEDVAPYFDGELGAYQVGRKVIGEVEGGAVEACGLGS